GCSLTAQTTSRPSSSMIRLSTLWLRVVSPFPSTLLERTAGIVAARPLSCLCWQVAGTSHCGSWAWFGSAFQPSLSCTPATWKGQKRSLAVDRKRYGYKVQEFAQNGFSSCSTIPAFIPLDDEAF